MAWSPDDIATEMGVRVFGADHVKTIGQPVDGRGGWTPWIREPYTGAWQKNDEWTADTVLAYHAVYACITLIANDIGKLREKLVEKDDNGIWSETESAAFSPLLRKPNRYQNHIQFKQWWMTSKLIRGNTYALKQRDNRGVVTGLYLLDPCRVQVLVAPDGSVFYQLGKDNISGLQEDALQVPATEIIHDRMNCLFHPLVGISPLFAAGQAALIGLNVEKNSANFFGNGSNPGGILTAPGAIGTDTANRLKEYWNTNFTGANAGKVAIAGDGLKYEPMRMSAVDSQLIEQLRWSAEVVCSVFHVPPYKIGVGTMPTFNNIEALQQDYYNTCLQSLIEEYELCKDEGIGIGEGVKIDGRVLGTELDLDGLIRMDTAAQMEVLTKGVSGSLLMIDEARAKLDRKAVPAGGSTIWMQQQNYSLDALMQRDASDPFAKPEPAPAVAEPVVPVDDSAAKAIAFHATHKAIEAARLEMAG
jgi:HK97 family phage portal protein